MSWLGKREKGSSLKKVQNNHISLNFICFLCSFSRSRILENVEYGQAFGSFCH